MPHPVCLYCQPAAGGAAWASKGLSKMWWYSEKCLERPGIQPFRESAWRSDPGTPRQPKDNIHPLCRPLSCRMAWLELTVWAAVLGLAVGQDITATAYPSELLSSSDSQDGCTVGVASGIVTHDGRPLLWKVRDISEGQARQQVVHVAGLPYSYIGVCTEGEGIYMGLSEAGVASGNSLVKLISGTAPNSPVQDHILRSFATVDQIEAYFLSEMQAGTCTASSCFPFVDASGDARIFEVNRSVQIWGYDCLNPARQAQGLYGLVVRANEFHMRSDGTDNTYIGGRYASGVYNCLGLIAQGVLSAGPWSRATPIRRTTTSSSATAPAEAWRRSQGRPRSPLSLYTASCPRKTRHWPRCGSCWARRTTVSQFLPGPGSRRCHSASTAA